MTTPLLQTKLYIPSVRPQLVPRLRVIERLNAGLRPSRLRQDEAAERVDSYCRSEAVGDPICCIPILSISFLSPTSRMGIAG